MSKPTTSTPMPTFASSSRTNCTPFSPAVTPDCTRTVKRTGWPDASSRMPSWSRSTSPRPSSSARRARDRARHITVGQPCAVRRAHRQRRRVGRAEIHGVGEGLAIDRERDRLAEGVRLQERAVRAGVRPEAEPEEIALEARPTFTSVTRPWSAAS
jgi:hypothetical protein